MPGRRPVSRVAGSGGRRGGAVDAPLRIGGFAVDIGLVPGVAGAAARPRPAEPLDAVALAPLGGALALVGLALALVGDALPFVGDPLALIGDAVAVVRRELAPLGSSLAAMELASGVLGMRVVCG